jgi:hypothetical protein
VKTHLAYAHDTNALETHNSLPIFSCKRNSRANKDALTGFYQPVYGISRIEIKALRKTWGAQAEGKSRQNFLKP